MVLGWLTRVALTLTLLGMVGFEVLSIAVTHVQIEDIGQTAAHEAITSFQNHNNVEQAYQAASIYADGHGAQITKKSFTITEESVTFDLEKVAPTLVLFRWDRLGKYAEVETTIYAEPLESGGKLS
jgi:hypothetical protein